jgi:thiosulfate sulfurtransferase
MTEQSSNQATSAYTFTRRLFRDILIILTLSVALAIGINALRPDGIALLPQAPPEPVVAMGESTMPAGPPVITTADAAAVLQDGTGVFIDARDRYAFAEAHIQGARHLDLLDMDVWMVEFYNTTQPDAALITYCEAANCSESTALAARLTEMGFENVFVLEGGWEAWRTQGLPVQEGLPD